MKIAVVIPVYGAPLSLPELHRRIVLTMNDLGCDYEIILVNDACPMNSWLEIKKLCAIDKNTKGINLARNFGQHAAISAGLAEANADWITVMDCDLQDDPAYIPEFLKAAGEDYDVVLARRKKRIESFFKKLQSWAFYQFLSLFLDVRMNHQIGNFGLYSRRTIQATLTIGDQVRFFPYLISWLSFPTTYVDITQNSRDEGKSSYTWRKSLKLAFEVALSSSNRPLLWSAQLGAICALGSFTLGTVFAVRYFTMGLAPSGWTSLIVTIFFSTGLILLSLGIFGLYLSRIYNQVRSRPVYVTREKINFVQ